MLRVALFVVAFTLPPLAFPQQSDITFIVAGKTSNHRQQLDGSVKTLNYHFLQKFFVSLMALFLQPASDPHLQPAQSIL